VLNAFERDVRRKVMTHLSFGHKADLSSGLVLVSIVIDLERIGDYSKNILDLARSYPGILQVGDLEDGVEHLEDAAMELFRGSAKAFREGDLDRARRIMETYKSDVSAPYRDLEVAMVSGKTSLDAAEAVTLALYLRFLKRIGAHSRNLISSLVNPFDRIGYPE
jgi:phosphate uptake regulator